MTTPCLCERCTAGMADFAIGIVAHEQRKTQATALYHQVSADTIAVDGGAHPVGCRANHLRVWGELAANAHAKWFVVLEDDAQPVDGFRDQLSQALAAAPSPVVSLYLGRTRPRSVQAAIHTATAAADDRDASWIVGKELFHGVAVAVRADLVADMLAHLPPPPLPADAAISTWAGNRRHPVAYTWPSICDHADEESVTRHPYQKLPADRTSRRVAWKTAARTTWTNTKVGL